MANEKENLKEMILNARKPIVLEDLKVDWQCFDNIDLEQYCESLHDCLNKNPLLFEKATKKWNSLPQWERFREHESITVKDFAEQKQHDPTFWYSYSYKGLNDLPELGRKGVDFSFLGIPNNLDNTFFWLSSKGSHTPCHYDTYGCNVVVQIYGTKRWLLFPPETKFNVTRIPYEESSIYCQENLFSPSKMNVEELSKLRCMKIDLKPGSILIVPKGWWHYVETLETSLSINYWIPLMSDRTSQIDECIVKFIIESTCQDEEKDYFLNPNQVIFL